MGVLSGIAQVGQLVLCTPEKDHCKRDSAGNEINLESVILCILTRGTISIGSMDPINFQKMALNSNIIFKGNQIEFSYFDTKVGR